MVQQEAAAPDESRPGRRRRSFLRLPLLILLLVILVAVALAWFRRDHIADFAIEDYLQGRGVQATYEIESIGPHREVLTNIVIGDPARPDLTVERAEIFIEPRFGLPGIRHVRLTRPRLFATYLDGELSFGQLDPLIYTGEERPFEFPGMEVSIQDGRGLIESDYGPVGVRLTGSGHLRGGFSAEIAAIAPKVAFPDCEASDVSLYGRLSINAERPRFKGPLRTSSLNCGKSGPRLARTTLQLNAQVDRDLAGAESDIEFQTLDPELGVILANVFGGQGRVTYRGDELVASYEVEGRDIAHPTARLDSLLAEGSVRAGDGFEWLRVESEFSGSGFQPGKVLDEALAGASEGAAPTMLGPILDKARNGIIAEARGSTLEGRASFRSTEDQLSFVVPEATLTGGSGSRLLALTRVQYAQRPDGEATMSGNLATGGQDLPRIAGRIEQRGGGGLNARLTMAEYGSGRNRLDIPTLQVSLRGGRFDFNGRARASGELPDGFADNLVLPIDGTWSDANGLVLWDGCTELRFDQLRYANLSLDGRSLALCPAKGQPIVRYASGDLKVAAGSPSLSLTGKLGETPIAIASGSIGFALPGAISARELNVALGPAGTATRFVITDLTAEVGKDIAGRFEGTDVFLYSVPADVLRANGNWRYADGRLSLSDGSFTLQDRQETERFRPMVARDAQLALQDNLITASALLREPTTDRAVADADLSHSLSSGAGRVDFEVPSLSFDNALLPDMIFPAAEGLVALVDGTIDGGGQIRWDENSVTSTGTFSTQSLDFAAAFGPVKSASGSVEFTDLLGLTTAPGQQLSVAAINPGIEVYDGIVRFQLIGGTVIQVEDATWPFLGGRLTMRPVRLNFGVNETRTYTLDIVGLEAPRFIERMELNNLSTTGVFDGSVPIVFDPEGNGRIEGGLLVSRTPGGNVAYVGDLTYEDLGAVANFAFDALRSLDYTRMRVAMDGPLTGEIVTRVRFDGVSQGAGTKQNLITEQIAKLPFRFDVNVRASFYQLLTNLRSIYDPAAIRDPRSVGLLDAEGNVISPRSRGPGLPVPPEDLPPESTPDEVIIQRSESEKVQ